ncbi:hypothetical protein GGE50_006349 [Rhizobium leguminosarum]|uniref:DUF3846 domain-containing protein n=1 Tax=Rhizobium leguminosarum TaxID=384 RepID=UPI001620ECC7|nr:protein psiB [Rhizobium leguminosarum]MBB4590417.1 hypothetical protein [Rhizobium leguminosarum]
MTKTAYLLDPETTLFRPVKLQDGISFKPLYELIGCRLIEVVRFDEKHSLFVDEEGLRDGLTAFTLFEGYPQPLAGKLVLVGGDGSEPYTSPLISIEDASAYFTCCRPVVDPVFATADELTPRGLLITGALLGFQLRFERRSPTLVEGEA